MANLEITENPSRRRFIGVAVVGSVLSPAARLALPAPEAANSPDAELIKLGDELERLWAEETRIARDADDETFEAAFDATGLIVDQIEETPAFTLDGLRVKARALYWCHGGVPLDNPFIQEMPTNTRLAHQIAMLLMNIRPFQF